LYYRKRLPFEFSSETGVSTGGMRGVEGRETFELFIELWYSLWNGNYFMRFFNFLGNQIGRKW